MLAFPQEDAPLLTIAKAGVSYPEWVIRDEVAAFLGRSALPVRLAQLAGNTGAEMLVSQAFVGPPSMLRTLHDLTTVPTSASALPEPGEEIAEPVTSEADGLAYGGNAWGVPLRNYDYSVVAVAWTDGRCEIEAELRGHALGSAFAACIAALVDFYVLRPEDRAAIAGALGAASVDVEQPGAPDYWEACGPGYIGAFAARWSEWPPLRPVPGEGAEATIVDLIDLDPVPPETAPYIGA